MASKDITTSKSQVEQNVANAPTSCFLFASNNPGTLIASVMFMVENHNEWIWSTELVNALRAKQKLDFIDGSIPKHAIDDLSFEP